MYVINAEFEDIQDISLAKSLDAYGVYVVWGARAKDRPTYIGEGKITDRLASHIKDWAGTNFDAVVTVLNVGGKSAKKAKVDAEIVEAAILEWGHYIDRRPTRNLKDGNIRRIDDLPASDHVLRINISGLHPLLPPDDPKAALKEPGRLQWNLEVVEGYLSWNGTTLWL